MKLLPHRERIRISKINKMMETLHNTNNDIYENWVDEDWEEMKAKLKQQINTLKQLLNGVQEET